MKDRSTRTVKKRSLDEDGGENTNEEIVGEDKKDDELKAQRRSAREESKVNFVGICEIDQATKHPPLPSPLPTFLF